MTRRNLLLALGLVLALMGCSRDVNWHQRVTLHLTTPGGPLEASAVQFVNVAYPGGFMAKYVPGGNNVHRRIEGEAVVADLGGGRYLFALLPGMDRILARTLARVEGPAVKLSEWRRTEEARTQPLDIPRELWPRLVTFTDIADPASVALVDSDDLAAKFGPGYALEAITVAVTDAPVTAGVVEVVLGKSFFQDWASNHKAALERGLGDPYFDTLSSQMNRSEFIRGAK